MRFTAPFIIRPANNLIDKHPTIKSLAKAITCAYNQHQLVPTETLKTIGELLWQALDVQKDFDQQVKKAKTNIMPIIIATDNPAINRLPWETLYHPTYHRLGTSKRFTLSRSLEQEHEQEQEQEPAQLEQGPLRVLLFTSLPDYPESRPEYQFSQAQRLNIEQEQAQVLEALLPLIREGKVTLEMPDDGRFETLCDTIEDKSPHVVFLSGHGSYIKSSIPDEPAQAVFEFEDIDGAPKPIGAADIATAFAGSNVQALVVSACESAKQAGVENDGLIQQLAEFGIANVVGMSESVYDYVGHYFAHVFCQSIAKGNLVAIAVQKARQSIAKMTQVPKFIDANQAAIEAFNSQWNFPVLYSQHHSQPLIDWDFEAKPVVYEQLNIQLHHVAQPKRFIGRRMELRKVQGQIKVGQHQWLFTGPGGQGKTALAGKIALNLERLGHSVFAWSAKQHEHQHQSMGGFISELQHKLGGDFAKTYDSMALTFNSEYDKALNLLQMLCRQQQVQTPNGKVVLFLDNLESLQSEESYDLTSPQVNAWIKASVALSNDGLVLILTSRWKMPDWPDSHCIMLSKLNYFDFMLLAQTLNCPKWLLKQTGRLRELHTTLHGNGRGLEFFLAAIDNMQEAEVTDFTKQLKNTKEELQTNMALNVIVQHLDDNDKIILKRMTAYQSPVPQLGLLTLVDALAGVTIDKQTALTSLQRLVNCALLEQHHNTKVEYFCSPVVADWIYGDDNRYFENQQLPDAVLTAAASYQLELFESTKRTLEQALVVYDAYLVTDQKDTAYQFALDYIIHKLELAGLYQTLLDNWMPELQKAQAPILQGEITNKIGQLYLYTGKYDTALDNFKRSLAIMQTIGDKQGDGASLNNISQIYMAKGDYDTALDYLKQSLAIMQTIGDKQGEGATLSNMSQIYMAKGDYDTAFDYLKQSLAIHQTIGDKKGEGNTLNNISQIYDAKGDYDTALDYLKQSLAIRQTIGDKHGEGTTLNNISQIYNAQGDYDTALDYLKQSLAIQQTIGDKQGEGITLNNMSQIYKVKGDYDTALDYLKQSLAICQTIGDKAGLCATLFNIGHIHLAKSETQQAMSAWLSVYGIAKPMGLAQALQALENVAEQIGLPNGLDGWEALYQGELEVE